MEESKNDGEYNSCNDIQKKFEVMILSDKTKFETENVIARDRTTFYNNKKSSSIKVIAIINSPGTP